MLAFALLAGCVQPLIRAKMSKFERWSLVWTYPEEVAPGEKLIEAYAIDLPTPSKTQLARVYTVKLGLVGTREGVVRFCATERGIRSVEMVRPTGDVALDELLCWSVRRWRIIPARVNRRPIEACTTARFVVTFE